MKSNQRTNAGTTLLIATLGATLLLGGCASSSSRDNRTTRVTETERVYRENGRVCRETEVTERTSGRDGGRVAGTVAGAVVGGVVGHQLGSGRGNDAATLGGAAAGAYAGNQIAKDRGRARSETVTECTRSRR